MTNEEYILQNIKAQDIAYACFPKGYLHEHGLWDKVTTAFYNWRKENDHPHRNYCVNGEEDPSTIEWSSIKQLDGSWKETRTSTVSFQIFLFAQYDEKYWKGYL